ncbi:hypothetical protein LQW54_010577 [Pestalotiopsis sp. IQ-011]
MAPRDVEQDLKTTEASQGIIVRPGAKTNSIRSMHRLLRSEGSLYPAKYSFELLVGAQVILAATLKVVPMMPAYLNDAVVTILTLQLQINWVCRVISKSTEKTSEKPAPSRFPQFRAAFRITAIPALVMSFAASMANSVALLAVQWLRGAVHQKLALPFRFYTLNIVTFALNVEVWKIGVYVVVRQAILAAFYLPAAAVLSSMKLSSTSIARLVLKELGSEGISQYWRHTNP